MFASSGPAADLEQTIAGCSKLFPSFFSIEMCTYCRLLVTSAFSVGVLVQNKTGNFVIFRIFFMQNKNLQLFYFKLKKYTQTFGHQAFGFREISK